MRLELGMIPNHMIIANWRVQPIVEPMYTSSSLFPLIIRPPTITLSDRGARLGRLRLCFRNLCFGLQNRRKASDLRGSCRLRLHDDQCSTNDDKTYSPRRLSRVVFAPPASF